VAFGLSRKPFEQPAVRVAHHDGAAELAQAREYLARLRAAGADVSEADELVDTAPGEVVEDGLEGYCIAMDIGDQGDALQRVRCR
jgi:hypothetical protein